MGKYTYAVLTVFAIELALYLFAGASYSGTTLFGLLFNPTNFLSNTLYTITILGVLAAFAASVIIPGNFYQINIFALYAGVIVVFISFGLSIIHLWQFIYGELSGMLTADFALMITGLLIAPIFLFYMMASLEWVRSNQ